MTQPTPVVGVVGAGTMGAGIAQVALEAGHEVLLNDVDEAAIERGHERIREGLGRRAAKLDLDADSIDEWVDGRLAGLRHAHSLDAIGGEAGVVIEAALEDLELKRTIFRALDAAAPGDVILATNTSALSVAAIAESTTRPDRVVGLHFFNPAPLMPLVEVVGAPASRAEIAEAAAALVSAWSKTAVRSADSPGFIVNRVNRPFTLEALATMEAGTSSVEAIDGAIREAGFPMGPFELMDLIGIDVNLAVATAIWAGFDRDERFRPSPTQERLVEAGRLGRKSGRGFYAYVDGRRAAVEPEFAAGAVEGVSPNEIVDRITLAVVNEAWRALGDGVATEVDIEVALRLGAAHPIGPFERTASLGGAAAVAAALEAHRRHGPRFEPATALVEAAR